MSEYPAHTKELSRINRVLGQLEGIKRMIQDKRYCVDILTQVRASRNALKTIELSILETHLGHCLAKAYQLNDEQKKAKQLREIINLLQKYE
ncbi:metal-sensitive transcriptional regulator [Legionella clemsonensis]|uniref:Copper-sensing transcriptional repressor CsoR n=1 Tax=Legionella clemsonensis TaxID=1867846 RepID=A0A222P548_9GAMM|nr:metal-sensitive transcriptional regulator [Legionella clemsonensis]ASQ46970.1 Copper-sensing transcriptional repressor CsoR [Legionella clemsonensis]